MSERQAVRVIDEHFDRLGGRYDTSAFAGRGRQWISERELDTVARALAGVRRGSRVLDAGCGNGRISELLADRLGHRVTALDPVAAMVRTATGRVAGLTAVQARLGEILPFRDRTFDAVVAIRVLKWVPDWRCALRELARVVRVGGEVVVEITNRRSVARFGYGSAPITLLAPAEVEGTGREAGILWTDTYAGTHLPHALWSLGGRRTTETLRRAQGVLDRRLGPTGARSLVLVGRRSRR